MICEMIFLPLPRVSGGDNIYIYIYHESKNHDDKIKLHYLTMSKPGINKYVATYI